MEKFTVNKPVAYRGGNNQILARILPVQSDMSSIDRSENPRYQFGHTILAWGDFSDMSDEDVEKADTLEEELKLILQDTVDSFPKHIQGEAMEILATGTAEDIYNVLSEAPNVSIFLLAFSKEDDAESVRKTTSVNEANALCIAVYDGEDKNFAQTWKENAAEQFEDNLFLFDLFIRKCVYDFIIETWEGSDDPEAHLEDGEGFDHDLYMCISHECVDLNDAQDVQYIWSVIDEFVAAMLAE